MNSCFQSPEASCKERQRLPLSSSLPLFLPPFSGLSPIPLSPSPHPSFSLSLPVSMSSCLYVSIKYSLCLTMVFKLQYNFQREETIFKPQYPHEISDTSKTSERDPILGSKWKALQKPHMSITSVPVIGDCNL